MKKRFWDLCERDLDQHSDDGRAKEHKKAKKSASRKDSVMA